jgi:FKBP-type peptidyl-prolyl cis-trans isomerase FkpA/FKBP-type peptidyl-prolyl cis-trans isomerase FklB
MKVLIKSSLATVALLTASSAWAVELDTQEAKLGYIIGMDVGQSLRAQGAEIDLDALFDAVRTLYEGGTPAITEEEAAAIRQAFISERQNAQAAEQAAVADGNKAVADAFLAENANAQGVVTTDSGLQYKVVRMGDGARPAATDTVTVHYRGTLLDGTEFDSSYARNEPISFALDRVIPGWTEGLQLMPMGSEFEFYISPELGYGATGGGPIPPNSALIFKVELLEIQ